jgi:hypothetical protein
MAKYAEVELLVRIGEHRRHDAVTDEAIDKVEDPRLPRQRTESVRRCVQWPRCTR